MTNPAPTAAPKPPTPAPAPAPASQPAAAQPAARDPYGEKRISLDKLPVVGHLKSGTFTPTTPQGETKEPPAGQEPPKEPAAAAEAAAPETPAPTDGQPAGEEGKPAAPETTVLKAKNGKTFKDAAELLATYDASAPEAQRLASENKTMSLTLTEMENQLTEARDSLLKMQEYVLNGNNGPAIPEKYQGKTEEQMLSEMTEPERLDYLLDKREWRKKVDTFKARLESAKTESEAIAARIKSEMSRVEQMMTKETDKYPDFEALGPLREDILKESPHLANRPDTPYLTYYLARGIMADREAKEKLRLEEESRAAARAKAGGAAASAGAGAPAPSAKAPAPKDDGLRGLVKAAKALKGSF